MHIDSLRIVSVDTARNVGGNVDRSELAGSEGQLPVVWKDVENFQVNKIKYSYIRFGVS